MHIFVFKVKNSTFMICCTFLIVHNFWSFLAKLLRSVPHHAGFLTKGGQIDARGRANYGNSIWRIFSFIFVNFYCYLIFTWINLPGRRQYIFFLLIILLLIAHILASFCPLCGTLSIWKMLTYHLKVLFKKNYILSLDKTKKTNP